MSFIWELDDPREGDLLHCTLVVSLRNESGMEKCPHKEPSWEKVDITEEKKGADGSISLSCFSMLGPDRALQLWSSNSFCLNFLSFLNTYIKAL